MVDSWFKMTLTPYVRVRILLPLPDIALNCYDSRRFSLFCGRTRLAALPFPALLRDGPAKGAAGFDAYCETMYNMIML